LRPRLAISVKVEIDLNGSIVKMIEEKLFPVK